MESTSPNNKAPTPPLRAGRYVLKPAYHRRLVELAEQKGVGDPQFVFFNLRPGLKVTAWYVGATPLPDGSTAHRYHVQSEESKVLPALLNSQEQILEVIKA